MNSRPLDTAFRLGSAFVAALLMAWCCGFAMLSLVPCSLFGASYAWACTTGVYLAASLFGLLVLVVGFAVLAKKNFDLSFGTWANPKPERLERINAWWLALLALMYLFPLLQLLPFINVMTALVSMLVLPAFLVASAMLAPYRNKHPAVAFIALVPMIGPAIVGFLLFRMPRRWAA